MGSCPNCMNLKKENLDIFNVSDIKIMPPERKISDISKNTYDDYKKFKMKKNKRKNNDATSINSQSSLKSLIRDLNYLEGIVKIKIKN